MGRLVLTEGELHSWLAFITPSVSEAGFRGLGFFTTLWEGVVEASRANAWNEDFVWFRRAEAVALATPGTSKAAIVSRFARTSLLDFARGQTEAFQPRDVVESRLLIAPLEDAGATQRLRVEGAFRLDHTAEPGEAARGVEAKLLGFANFDSDRQRFVAFEAVALGTRWGGTKFNGRYDDPGPSEIGWAFVLAGDSPADRIAPAHFWDAYDW